MSRQAKVRMADILIGAGYGLRKVLSAIKYPTIETLTYDGKFTQNGLPGEPITIGFSDEKKGNFETTTLELGENYDLSEEEAYSTITTLQHDGLCYFTIKYSQMVQLTNKYSSTNNDPVPIVPGYPTPKALMPSKS